jgi:hypothetical protein
MNDGIEGGPEPAWWREKPMTVMENSRHLTW